MSYCGPIGLPRSTFLRWDRDDQDAAIVWQMRRNQTCQSCGTRPDEWDPALGGRDDAYRAELHKCWGCHAKAAAEKSITDSMGAGVFVALARAEGPPLGEDPDQGDGSPPDEDAGPPAP